MENKRSGTTVLETQPGVTREIGKDDVPCAFTTRRVPRDSITHLICGDAKPRAGDLVLVRIDALGQHTRIQLPSRSRRNLFVGDEVILCYGNRYAPRQFEAIVPKTLEPCHLVAAGGLAGKALLWHEKLYRGPTEVTPIGLVADASGHRVNVADYALPDTGPIDPAGAVVIGFAGTEMSAGKTTAAAFLAHGLVRSGLRVGYAKITGTGAGGDLGLVSDAGASPVVDFTDAGHVTTCMVSREEIKGIVTTLVSHLQRAGVDVILLELADGLFQAETAAILESSFLHRVVDGMIFCGSDAMGAACGFDWLRRKEYAVLALAGILTRSPLQAREAMQVTGIPVLSRIELADPITASKLAQEARMRRGPA